MRSKTVSAIAFLLVSGITGVWGKAANGRVMRVEATAFSKWTRPTSSGAAPHYGIVAADPQVLPLGTVIRVSGAGAYSGVYVVTDTGERIDGRRIDLYIPSTAAAKRFGKRLVQVEVLDEGKGKRDARAKDPAGTAAAGARVNSAPQPGPARESRR
jgi:3D (Asp-Asp-Asp) domain-containing protein